MVHVRDEIPEIPVTGVSIKGEDSHIIKVGEYISLEEEIAPEDATNQNVTWSSSDENIAKVDAYGTVTGVGVGEATITVKTEDGGKEATCAITVVGVPVEKLTLTETTLILGEGEKVNVITSKNATNNLKGEKKDLGVVITPENATNKKIKWSSSNNSVVTVSKDGKIIKAGNRGTAELTAIPEDGGDIEPAKCIVHVGFRIKLERTSYTYTGKAIKPQVEVYDGERLLTEKKDYTISYKNNIKAKYNSNDQSKMPQVIVKGKGNYAGISEPQTFEISKADINGKEFSADDMAIAFTGKDQKPIPVLLWNGKKLKNKTDFTTTYIIKPKEPNCFLQTERWQTEGTGRGNRLHCNLQEKYFCQ